MIDEGSGQVDAVAHRFRRTAERWDSIYSERGGGIATLWDRLTRRNVRWRFGRTFEAMPNLMGRSVLDLGCGSGRYLVEALTRGADRVVGVDLAPEMLGIAADLIAEVPMNDRCELIAGDLFDLDFGDPFDLVIANGLFDYVKDGPALLERAAAACSGVLVASFPDARAPRAWPRRRYWQRKGVDIFAFTQDEIDRLAMDGGLSAYTIERWGPLYLLIAQVGAGEPGL